MMLARIYNKSKSSTQSGKKGRTGKWVLEFERQIAPYIEPLLGYTSSKDTLQQVKLFFLSLEEAEKYAKDRSCRRENHFNFHLCFQEYTTKRSNQSCANSFLCVIGGKDE